MGEPQPARIAGLGCVLVSVVDQYKARSPCRCLLLGIVTRHRIDTLGTVAQGADDGRRRDAHAQKGLGYVAKGIRYVVGRDYVRVATHVPCCEHQIDRQCLTTFDHVRGLPSAPRYLVTAAKSLILVGALGLDPKPAD